MENQCEDSSVSCCECRIDAGAGVEERSLLSCFVENTGDRVEAGRLAQMRAPVAASSKFAGMYGRRGHQPEGQLVVFSFRGIAGARICSMRRGGGPGAEA